MSDEASQLAKARNREQILSAALKRQGDSWRELEALYHAAIEREQKLQDELRQWKLIALDAIMEVGKKA